METIAEGRAFIAEGKFKGVHCPVCDKWCKANTYKPMWAQMVGLINLYNLDLREPGPHHIRKLGPPDTWSALQKLKHAGLIVADYNDDPKKRTSGSWAITEKGKAFVRGEISIPSGYIVYNDELLGIEEGHITIHDAIKGKFDYEEAMKTTGPFIPVVPSEKGEDT